MIDALAINPRPHGYKKLRGVEDIYRVRSGGYRVLYQINDDAQLLEVLIVKVGDRADVYRYLRDR